MPVGDVVTSHNSNREIKTVSIIAIQLIGSNEVPMIKTEISFLSVAVKHGDMNVIESLLKPGANPNGTVNIKRSLYNTNHITFLSWAIMNGNYEMMMLLLKYVVRKICRSLVYILHRYVKYFSMFPSLYFRRPAFCLTFFWVFIRSNIDRRDFSSHNQIYSLYRKLKY